MGPGVRIEGVEVFLQDEAVLMRMLVRPVLRDIGSDETNLMFRNGSLCVVANIPSDGNTDKHEEPDNEVIVSVPLHPLVADPWFLISDVH